MTKSIIIKPTVVLGLLILIAFSSKQLHAQNEVDYSTEGGILSHKLDGTFEFELFESTRHTFNSANSGIIIRGYNRKAKLILPIVYFNTGDSFGVYHAKSKKFQTIFKWFATFNISIAPISPIEYLIIFTKGERYPYISIKDSAGLYYDIYNTQTHKMQFAGYGKLLRLGTFDMYSSGTIDVSQKPNKNYEFWLVAHNQDSLCVFSLGKDTCYLNDVYVKKETESFLNNKEVGLYQLLGVQNRNILYSQTGKYIVYQQIHNEFNLINPDVVSYELYTSLQLFNFNPHTGKIGTVTDLDASYFQDDMKFDSLEIPYLLSPYKVFIGDRPLFSDNDSLLFYKKSSINRNTSSSKDEYNTILRYKLTDIQAKPDSLTIPLLNNERHPGYMIWAEDRNIYTSINTNPDAKLIRIGKPYLKDPKKISLDSSAVLRHPNFYGRYLKRNFEEKYYPILQYQSSCTSDTVTVNNLSHPYFTNFEWTLKRKGKTLLLDTSKNISFTATEGGNYSLRLKAWRPDGQTKIIDTLVSAPKTPKATIKIDSTVACAYQKNVLYDASTSDTVNATTGASWDWKFYKDNNLAHISNQQNPNIEFTKEGDYRIELVYSNGFCKDRVIKTNAIHILAAPKPGFSISDTIGCTPLQISLSSKDSGAVIERSFTWNNGLKSNQKNWLIDFDKEGIYKVTQTLKGPTGCTTKDSSKLHLHKGFDITHSSELLTATVLDSQQVLLKWQAQNQGKGYVILRMENNAITDSILLFNALQDTLVDTVPISTQKQAYQYRLYLLDSCDNVSRISNPASTILLQAKNLNNNYIVLNWNPYETWQKGVLSYEVERSFDKTTWQNINSVQKTNYQDEQNNQEHESVFYRIKAIERDGNQEQSTSNIVETSLQNSLFIPNAFSPNGDGINDIFKIGYFGFTHFECSIYNRSGQIVAFSNNPDAIWDGTFNGIDYPIGTYKYSIKATDYQGKEVIYSGRVQLLR